MNPEQQRVAIAEACERVQRPDGSWFPIGKDYGSAGIPNYLNDLNAMHDAEKVLTEDKRGEYRHVLIDALRQGWGYATAPQRAEAFLRTIGKWEEAK